MAAGGFSGRFFMAIFFTLNILLLAFLLEPRDYGIYLLFVRILSLITLLGDLGLGQSAAAHFSLFAALDRLLHRKFVRIVAFSSVLVCLLALILFLTVQGLLVPDLPLFVLLLLVVSLPANIYFNVWSGMMVGSGLIWPLNMVRTVTAMLFLGGTLLFVWFLEGGLAAALSVYCGATLLQMLAMMAVARTYSTDAVGERPAAPALVHFGLRSYFNAVFYFLWTTLPLFILTAEEGPVAAGLFGLATQILDKLLLPAQALHEAVFQRMRLVARACAAGETLLYAALIFIVAGVTAILAAPFVYWAIPLLLGDDYGPIGPLGAFLLVGLPFMSALLLFDPFFVNALQRPGLASWLAALQVAITAGLCLFLIPYFGLFGAALGLVLAQAIGALLALLTLKYSAPLPWSDLGPQMMMALRRGRSEGWLRLGRSGARS